MTSLFDRTVQHQGWQGGTFAAGEWADVVAPLVTGVSARSFWMSSLNQAAIDVSLGFCDSAGNRTSPAWINTHTAATLTGLTIPSPQLITPSTFVLITTRTPSSSGSILERFIVSDGGTTPPPTSPP